MRTITQNVYSFNELTTQAKQKAVDHYLEYGMPSDNWWSDTYYDARETAHIKIEGFSIDRDRHINIRPLDFDSAYTSAQKIISEHGESCTTYSIAKNFLSDLEQLQRQTDNEQEIEELEDNYFEAIGNEYLLMLEREFEEITSEEYIAEYFESHAREFFEDGTIYKS
jgi:hypothetical protein